MSERTVARCEPDTTNGIVVNVTVKPANWVNDDPTHLIEYTPENPAGIGWQVINGVVIIPPAPESENQEGL